MAVSLEKLPRSQMYTILKLAKWLHCPSALCAVNQTMAVSLEKLPRSQKYTILKLAKWLHCPSALCAVNQTF